MKWEDRDDKDVVAQAVAKAKEEGDRKARVAEAEGKIVTEEMRKEWEKAGRVFNWGGAAMARPKGMMLMGRNGR